LSGGQTLAAASHPAAASSPRATNRAFEFSAVSN
jgi:hypothetical protein